MSIACYLCAAFRDRGGTPFAARIAAKSSPTLSLTIMEYTLEKNEQYALIGLTEPSLDAATSLDLAKVVSSLSREGYANLIVDLKSVQSIENEGITLLRKANDLCLRDDGLLVLVTKDDDLIERLDSAQIRDLTILPTTEEAVDAIFMNELENDFKEEEDDEFDYGGEGESEGSKEDEY
jgi:anti-anti-sigma regulatory factor